jgi:hypothetical protein
MIRVNTEDYDSTELDGRPTAFAIEAAKTRAAAVKNVGSFFNFSAAQVGGQKLVVGQEIGEGEEDPRRIVGLPGQSNLVVLRAA